ncbi:hypothetical protein WJX81_006670 [Elliptochloris bilobata]|uniref:Uncharacterized protein n=1 Tax=Elliptochloris bilobata TaxID=381761 RepID=A0AAW1RI83_9CHLO
MHPSKLLCGHAAPFGSYLPTAPSPASVHRRFSSAIVRATDEQTSVVEPAAAEPSSSSLFDGFPFSKGQEVINARAAMAGFVAAVISEVVTQKSVWTQIAGRYSNGDLITRANGTASLLFGAIVVLLSYATLAPYFLKGETNTARSFGPFTPTRERDVGRVAMMGFALLLAVETARGGTPVF